MPHLHRQSFSEKTLAVLCHDYATPAYLAYLGLTTRISICITQGSQGKHSSDCHHVTVANVFALTL
jgi:hypothetical protein